MALLNIEPPVDWNPGLKPFHNMLYNGVQKSVCTHFKPTLLSMSGYIFSFLYNTPLVQLYLYCSNKISSVHKLNN